MFHVACGSESFAEFRDLNVKPYNLTTPMLGRLNGGVFVLFRCSSLSPRALMYLVLKALCKNWTEKQKGEVEKGEINGVKEKCRL